MRVLALHGLGATGAMLKEQLAPFMRALGRDFEVVFVDGAFPCERGPAVPGWATGPFRSYASGFTPLEMQAAHANLKLFLDCKGPFDGVVGFSLGAAVAMSFILEHQRRLPHEKPPFSFAVLFSPIFVASADPRCYEDLVKRLLNDNHAGFRTAFPHGDLATSLKAEDELVFADYLRTVLSMHKSVGSILPDNNTRFEFFDATDGQVVGSENVPRLLHPALHKCRLRIPAVVVTGLGDEVAMAEQSRVATQLCAPSLTSVYTHTGAHDIPYRKADVEKVVSLIRDAAEDGMQLLSMYDL